MSPKDTDETQQLYHDTRTLLETFDPTRLCPYLNSTTADAYDAQAAFYNIIREGKELDGMHVCVCVCVCVCICVCACAYVYAHVHMCTRMSVHGHREQWLSIDIFAHEVHISVQMYQIS